MVSEHERRRGGKKVLRRAKHVLKKVLGMAKHVLKKVLGMAKHVLDQNMCSISLADKAQGANATVFRLQTHKRNSVRQCSVSKIILLMCSVSNHMLLMCSVSKHMCVVHMCSVPSPNTFYVSSSVSQHILLPTPHVSEHILYQLRNTV